MFGILPSTCTTSLVFEPATAQQVEDRSRGGEHDRGRRQDHGDGVGDRPGRRRHDVGPRGGPATNPAATTVPNMSQTMTRPNQT